MSNSILEIGFLLYEYIKMGRKKLTEEEKEQRRLDREDDPFAKKLGRPKMSEEELEARRNNSDLPKLGRKKITDEERNRRIEKISAEMNYCEGNDLIRLRSQLWCYTNYEKYLEHQHKYNQKRVNR